MIVVSSGSPDGIGIAGSSIASSVWPLALPAPHDRRRVPADGLVADREEPAVDGGDALDRLRTRTAQ